MDVLAAYSYDMFKVGAEYFSAKNWAVTSKDKATGYSVWGSVAPGENVEVHLGRVDEQLGVVPGAFRRAAEDHEALREDGSVVVLEGEDSLGELVPEEQEL